MLDNNGCYEVNKVNMVSVKNLTDEFNLISS